MFTGRVRELSGEAKTDFANALSSLSASALVRSTFKLPVEQREAIRLALKETFAADIQLSFETAPAVISGIELSANGHKVGWSIAEYLTSLERNVDELLREPSQPPVESADKPKSKNE